MVEAKEYVKMDLVSKFRPCGTCAMMSRELNGVANSRLSVHRVRDLRVVVASVFPIAMRRTIQSSVYAVAERPANLIREGWRVGKA